MLGTDMGRYYQGLSTLEGIYRELPYEQGIFLGDLGKRFFELLNKVVASFGNGWRRSLDNNIATSSCNDTL